LSDIRHFSGRVAALSRSRPTDDPEFVDAQRDLAAAKLERAVRNALDSAPSLTDAQAQRIAALLLTGGAA